MPGPEAKKDLSGCVCACIVGPGMSRKVVPGAGPQSHGFPPHPLALWQKQSLPSPPPCRRAGAAGDPGKARLVARPLEAVPEAGKEAGRVVLGLTEAPDGVWLPSVCSAKGPGRWPRVPGEGAQSRQHCVLLIPLQMG